MSQASTNDSNDVPPAGETSLAHYLDALAADASIPGGGGAAALAGALAAALLSMVSRFTLGRTRYEESWPHIEPLLAESERLRKALLQAGRRRCARLWRSDSGHATPTRHRQPTAGAAHRVASGPPRRDGGPPRDGAGRSPGAGPGSDGRRVWQPQPRQRCRRRPRRWPRRRCRAPRSMCVSIWRSCATETLWLPRTRR